MRSRFSFWMKLAMAAGFAALADILVYRAYGPGVGIAILALSLVVGLAVAAPALHRNRLSLAALAVAGMAGAIQIERPSVVALALYVLAIGVAVLAPRAPRGEDALRWAARLFCGVRGLAGPLLDFPPAQRAFAKRSPIRLSTVATAAVLPVVGTLVFLGLFVAANPLLAGALRWLALPALDVPQVLFVAISALIAWTALRPRGVRLKLKPRAEAKPWLSASVGSVVASLVIFNVIFAFQNGLDIAFLWSGAALPEGMTHAQYAHRGAYPLIATALLAGLFVLVFLAPDSATGRSAIIRRLVSLWIAQNVFLVASTMLRTAAYIEAYSLTRMRIAALLWMALVALGLILIAWRLLRAKPAGWLINANVLAVGVVLAGCAVVDLGSIAAAWNVRNAKEVGGKGVELDVAHFERELGGAGLVALAELEQRPLPRGLCMQVKDARKRVRDRMEAQQADWRGWRWRDARRLQRDAELGGDCRRSLPPLPLTAPPKP